MTWYLLLVGIAGATAALTYTLRSSGASISWLGGMMLFYLGQRVLAGGDHALLYDGAGLLFIVGSFGLRWMAMSAAEGNQSTAQRHGLVWQLVGTASLLVYALTTESGVSTFGLEGDSVDRWTVSWTAVWPILWLAGALPMVLIDLVIRDHPRLLPMGAVNNAVQAGLSLAFGLALVFPANYLADAHDVDADFSYFRVTKPGSSTQALVSNLDEPVEVLLFYAPGNDTKEKMLPYFSELADSSGGKLSVEVVDQAMSPQLAKDLSVRDNGYVVLRKGDANQKFKVDEELKRARRDLKKLDGTFRKHLIKLAKGKRIAYVLTGHGEASARDESPFFKLGEFKKILREQNYDVKDFGIDSGSTSAVPDDAALVIIPAPERELLPEEVEVLKGYVDGGGALLVYADPGRDRMVGLMDHIGIDLGEHPLAHATKFAAATRGITDRVNLVTNRFGSHASVSTLSKYSSKAAMVFLTTAMVREKQGGGLTGAKYTPLIRTFEDTWEEMNGDYTKGAGEEGKTHVIAMAVEGPEANPARVIVVGDVAAAGDFLMQRFAGNFQFALDATTWLVGEEDMLGEVNNEEDVRIEHTSEEDQVWFYGTIFGVPLLVLVVGGIFVSRRSRKGGR
jgi:thiol-disulfide isomerase/thioredoxin